jgi:hypothetical protein
MKEKIIFIETSTAKKYQKILDIKEGFYPDAGQDEVMLLLRTDFGDGIEADIKVCNGNTPYVDPVLFNNGSEVCVGEVSDTLVGDYAFDYAGETYKVKIKIQKKQPWK